MRRLVLISSLSGTVAGLLWFAAQYFFVVPLIHVAEVYESASHSHDNSTAAHHSHGEDSDEWQPAPGWQRNSLTAAATVLTGIAFSSILFGTITGLGRQINARSGALWGVAGFLCFNAAPALGLPPQPPGVALADLMQRQVWWVGTVVLTAVGLWLLAGKRSAGWPLRVAGMAAMILPHAIGAPEASGKSVVPTALVAQFTTVCLAGAALFWVALGGCGGFLAERYGTNPEA